MADQARSLGGTVQISKLESNIDDVRRVRVRLTMPDGRRFTLALRLEDYALALFGQEVRCDVAIAGVPMPATEVSHGT